MAAKKEAAAAPTKGKAKAKVKTKKKKVAAKTLPKNWKVKLSDLELAPEWNRQKLGDNSAMQASLSLSGQTTPITVWAGSAPGKWEVIDGMRRRAAADALGWTHIEVCYSTAKTRDDAVEEAGIANLVRKGHTPGETLLIFQKAAERGKSLELIARTYGCSAGFVSQHLAVLRADSKLQKSFMAGTMPLVMFRQFSKLDLETDAEFYAKMMDKAFNKVSAQTIGDIIDAYKTRKAEKAARAAIKAGGKAPKAPAKRGGAAHKNTPKLVLPDYTAPEVAKLMKFVGKKHAIECLAEYRTRALEATSARERDRWIYGLEGMERVTGLLVED